MLAQDRPKSHGMITVFWLVYMLHLECSPDSVINSKTKYIKFPVDFLSKVVSSAYAQPAIGYYKYSRVHISSDKAFFKILKKPSIVQK